jgi:hypothetical protein
MSEAPKGFRKSVRRALLARPEWVEPGVLLQDQALRLPDGRRIRLHGVDVLGRPCLVGVFRELDAEAYDWLLAVACAFRDGMLGGDPVYSRGREPRLFVVAPWFRPEDLVRLDLLSDAVDVRALRVRRCAESWATELVHPRCEFGDLESWLEASPAALRGFLRRLYAVAQRGGQRCEFQGQPWPICVAGGDGPLASIHRDGERLLYLAVRGAGEPPEMLALDGERGQDQAIDHLLRVAPLAEVVA